MASPWSDDHVSLWQVSASPLSSSSLSRSQDCILDLYKHAVGDVANSTDDDDDDDDDDDAEDSSDHVLATLLGSESNLVDCMETNEVDGPQQPGLLTNVQFQNKGCISPFFSHRMTTVGSIAVSCPTPSENVHMLNVANSDEQLLNFDDNYQDDNERFHAQNSTNKETSLTSEEPQDNSSFILKNICDPPASVSQVVKGISKHKRTHSLMDISEITKENGDVFAASVSSQFLKSIPDLHKASSAKKLREMLKHPLVDPDSRNELGDTPLHTYIRKAYSNRFKLLFSLLSCNRKVDIDAYDSDENTPLHIAVRMNDISSATVLIAFGANSEKKNLHNQLPLDLAVGSGQLRNMLKRFALKPQFNILQRDRKYTVDPCSQHAADKIGYYLNWRREAHLTLKMEKEIAKLMNQDYINDVTESGAAFIQLNHIKHWKETRGSQSRPGSRVLFLDGGGIRGLIQLEILIEMECRLKRKITDLFDWIVGTSTGGIIALALTYTELNLI